jgi:hypothetical protein
MAAELALERMKSGRIPVVFGSQKPKPFVKARFGVVSISLLVCMVIFSPLPLLWCVGYFQHEIKGKVGSASCRMVFHKGSGSVECFSDERGEFRLRLDGGIYRITVFGNGVPEGYSDISRTPFRIKVLKDLEHVHLQIVK